MAVVAAPFPEFSSQSKEKDIPGAVLPQAVLRPEKPLSDVTEQAAPPSEERCHNVATTGVDSGGLQETGGDDCMAGT